MKQPKQEVSQPSTKRYYPCDEGWSYAVAIASFVTHALMATVYFGYSVLTPSWLNEFQTTSGVTSLVGSAASGFSSGLAPVASFISNRFNHRTTHMIGGVTASLGIFLCSFASSLEQIFIFYGFFAGFGIGICYLPAVMIMKDYFQKKYALFMGFASCGIGVGSCVFPIFIEKLESVYGWRGALLILSGVMGNMCVSAAALFPNPDILINQEINGNFIEQDRVMNLIDSSNDNEKQIALIMDSERSGKETKSTGFWSLTRRVLTHKYFHLGIISNFTNFFCMMLVIGLTPMRCQLEFHMTSEQGALLASGIGFSNMVARFLWGAVCSFFKINPLNFFLFLRLMTTLLTIGSIFVTSFRLQLLFCILLGAGFGSWSLYPIYVPRMFDAAIVDTAFGYLEIFNGVGCLVGPFVGGLIYDVTGSFTVSFILAGGVLLLGTVVMFIGSRCIQQPSPSSVAL